MIKTCVRCRQTFDAPYRGWYERYVPLACSTKCFQQMLANIVPNGEENPFIQPQDDPRIKEFHHRITNFRSTYEAQFNTWLHRQKIPHQYEPYFLELANKSRYVPDFLAYGNVFVEVKGIWTPEGKKKFLSVIKEFYGLPIVAVDREFIALLKRTEKTRP